MPPCFDVYALTGERNLAMIEQFVREFTSSDLDEPGAWDLHVVPADHDGTSELRIAEDYDEVRVDSLAEAIHYGLAEPGRAFSLHPLPASGPLCGAVLAFTVSNEVLVGVSVHDEDDPDDDQPLDDARELVARLANLTGARQSWIGLEEAPTLDPDRDRPWMSPLAARLAAESVSRSRRWWCPPLTGRPRHRTISRRRGGSSPRRGGRPGRRG